MTGGYCPAVTDDETRDQLLRDELDRQDGKDPLRGSRTSGFWAAVVGLAVVLLLLIVFIAQNTRRTTVSFLAWDGEVPVAVALLIAAAGRAVPGRAGRDAADPPAAPTGSPDPPLIAPAAPQSWDKVTGHHQPPRRGATELGD